MTRYASVLRGLAAFALLGSPAAAQPLPEPPAGTAAESVCCVDSAPAAARQPPAADRADIVRFFFGADAHSRHALMDRFIQQVRRERPGLVIDGGDLVHDGTESEFRRAIADRERLGTPWHAVRGNHDALTRGPYFEPPPLPDFAAFDHEDIRFILLDNHDGRLGAARFDRLERELRAHAGRRVIVVLHVPPILSRERAFARLRRLLPFRLAETAMTDADEVARFTRLMEHHGVLAVLAGHTHAPDEVVHGGVRYIVAGAVGGLTPGFGIANEYLDIVVRGRELHVRRVPLNRPANPVSLPVRAFRFYADLNGFNHAAQGWNYVPSASVQWRAALTRIERRGDEAVVVTGVASFERVLGARGRQAFFSDVGMSAGRNDLLPHVSAGYRLRPAGTYNRNVYVAGAVSGNAGMLRGDATAGIGMRAAIGLEWRGITFDMMSERATNHRAMSLAAGRRF